MSFRTARLSLFTLITVTLSGPILAAEVPSYVAETETSGINHTYEGGFQYMAGAGVAAFDCNRDGLPELYFAGGEAAAKLYRNSSLPGGPLRFREDAPAGLSLTSVTGAYPLDMDGDGITDLAVLRVGENVLMRGLGGCKFERANEAWGFDGAELRRLRVQPRHPASERGRSRRGRRWLSQGGGAATG